MANVPEIRVEFDPNGSPSTAAPEWRDLSEYARLSDGINWSSGRQDETASIQAGVMSVNLNNDGGIFTPGSGEAQTQWGTDLRIRVPIRLRARYGGGSTSYGTGLYGVGTYSPTIAGNLLSAESASFEGGTVGDWTAGGTVAPTLSVSTSHPQDGAKGLLITWGTGGTLPQAGVTVTGLVIGRYYTASAYVYVPTGSPDPLLAIAGSVLGAATATKNALERISVTWQATASSATVQVWPNTAPTAGQTCYVDAVQVDEGTTLGDFTTAAPPVYDLWSGFIDSWDGAWTGGRRSVTQVRASDRVARLSRKSLPRAIDAAAITDGAITLYPLTEDSASVAGGDIVGNVWAERMTQLQTGVGGTLTFGSIDGPSIEGGTAVTLTPASVTNGISLQASQAGSSYQSTDALTIEAWVKTTTAAAQCIMSVQHSSLEVTAAGKLMAAQRASTGNVTVTSAASITGGTWRHVAATFTRSAGNVSIEAFIDGASVGTSTAAGSPLVAQGWQFVGSTVIPGDLVNTMHLTGSVASVAVYESALTSTQIAAHYAAGVDAFSGDSTDERFDRLCQFAQIPAALFDSPEVGLTTLGTQPLAGKSALAALTEVANDERGLVFVDRSGVVTFHARSHRYNSASAFTLLGSDVSPDLAFTVDDQNIVNDATVARYGGATTRQVNQSSVDMFDTYDLSVSTFAASDDYAANLAQYLVNTYGTPAARSSTVEVDLYAKAETAPVASILGASIGTRFTLASLPDSSSAPSTTVDLFVEGIAGSVNEREFRWRANSSPVTASAVWALDSTTYSQLDSSTILAF